MTVNRWAKAPLRAPTCDTGAADDDSTTSTAMVLRRAHPVFQLNALDQVSGLLRQLGDHACRLDSLASEQAMPPSVPVSLRSAATGSMHPADAMSPNRRRSALETAPLRFGVASRRQVHGQFALHEVDPRLFLAPHSPSGSAR